MAEITLEKGEEAAGFSRGDIETEGPAFYGKRCTCKVCSICQEAAATKRRCKELILRYCTYFSRN